MNRAGTSLLVVSALACLSLIPGGARVAQARDLASVEGCSAEITVLNAQDSGAGSLRQAIADVCEGGTIGFALPLPATITLTGGELVIDRAMTILGPGADLLAISGNGLNRVFSVSGDGVRLKDLTLQEGMSSVEIGRAVNGGAVLNTGALTLENSVVIDSGIRRWVTGGGLFNAGHATLVNVTIRNNEAGGGGGIHNTGSLALDHVFIHHNVARFFGGNIANVGTAVVADSAIGDGNDSVINEGVMTITNSAIYNGYTGRVAGGILNWEPQCVPAPCGAIGGVLALVNTTFSGNDSAIVNRGGSVTLANSTVAFNGLGIENENLGGNLGSVTLVNTIVAANNS